MTEKNNSFNVSIFSVCLGVFFVLFSIIFNLISYFATGFSGLLKPWANIILLLLSAIPSVIGGFKLAKIKKFKNFSLINSLFPLVVLIICFFILNILPFINDGLKSVWSIFSIITIHLAYILFLFTLNYGKIKSFVIKSVLSFLIFGTSYFIITLAIGRLGTGGNILIIIFVYLILYFIITLLAYIVSRAIKSKQNQAKKYTKQF